MVNIQTSRTCERCGAIRQRQSRHFCSISCLKAANADRFWLHVDKTDSCWNWTGSTRPYGYGRFQNSGIAYLAHRYSFALINGPIPDGMLVCHHCDNPRCVRPDHLFLGTTLDNVKDKIEKGRGYGGEAHYRAKLTQDDIRAIRAAKPDNPYRHHRAVARMFNVSHCTIARIWRGQGWKHVK